MYNLWDFCITYSFTLGAINFRSLHLALVIIAEKQSISRAVITLSLERNREFLRPIRVTLRSRSPVVLARWPINCLPRASSLKYRFPRQADSSDHIPETQDTANDSQNRTKNQKTSPSRVNGRFNANEPRRSRIDRRGN